MSAQKTRYILIFPLQGQTPDPALLRALQECALLPLLPAQLSELPENAVEIPLIIVDRPIQSAVTICANLRKQPQFLLVPILVLVDYVDDANRASLSALQTDIIHKPVNDVALQRYLSLKTRIAPEPVIPAVQDQTIGNNPYRADGSIEVEKDFGLARELKIDSLEALKEGQREGELVKVPGTKFSPEAADKIYARYAYGIQDEVNPLDIENLSEDSVQDSEQEKPAIRVPKLSPNEPVKNEMPDHIPSADSLLKSIPAQAELSKGGLPCTKCHWRCRREDVFCSRCGKVLAFLAPLQLTTHFEPLGNHTVGQLLEFTNQGLNPLRLTFRLHANSQIGSRFQLHTQSAWLEGGNTQHLLITFDARGLDLTIGYGADLEIISNEKGRSTYRVELIVERLPIPKIITCATYSYILSGGNEWEIQLSNEGGGSLKLLKTFIDDTPLSFQQPVEVSSGRPIEIQLAVPEIELSIGTYTKKLRCEFEHFGSISRELEICAIKPARLVATPTEIDFGVVSTRRLKTFAITIFNSGAEELLVESFVPSVPWIECFVSTPFSVPAGNTVIIDMQACGRQVPEGDSFGELEIKSNSHLNAKQTILIRAKFVEPREYEPHIGIDFGTTASCVAIFEDSHPVIINIDVEGQTTDSRIMPSVLYFQEDGGVITGREALEESLIHPANAVTSIKRVLGVKQHKRIFAGREYSATEMAAKIIEQLVARTEDALFEMGQYKTPKRAVVTVPVEFSDNQRRALLDACQLVGLEIESHSHRGIVIDEAHAAALYYLNRSAAQLDEDRSEKLLIFDFGGGTLDCVLVEIEERNGKILFNTLSLSGDSHLGGEDIDWKIVKLLADRAKLLYEDFDTDCLGDEKKFEYKYRSSDILAAVYRTRAAFKRQAEIAKITLGKEPSVTIVIEPLLRFSPTALEPYVMDGSKPARLEVTLERSEFEAAISPLIDKAIGVVETVCHRGHLLPGEIDTILHVGRTSLIPLVRDRVNQFLSNARDGSDLVEPKLCVAMGAAFWGYIKDKPGADIEFIGATNRTIHDIGYISLKRLQQTFTPVFAAQTEFPCTRVVEFSISGQTIDLTLAENHGKETTVNGNAKLIGVVRINTREAGGEPIPVNFAINENRILEITVHGQTQQILDLGEEQ
jgi:molecular chaperone DnaK